MICTIYSHYLGFDKVLQILQTHYPQANISSDQQNGSLIGMMRITNESEEVISSLQVLYRERKEPSYFISQEDDSPLVTNLKGLYGFVDSLPSKNEEIKNFFLRKILTINAEFSLKHEGIAIKNLDKAIQAIAEEFDAVLFVQPDTIISQSKEQHFLDKNLQLIIDTAGNCEINELLVVIDSVYYDKDKSDMTVDQQERKKRSEQILEQNGVKINYHLPPVESEAETIIRTPREIAERVTILTLTNMVAFGHITGEDATDYLQAYHLWDLVTPNEKEFLANPTEEKKMHETWKCEGIWTLMWALGKVDELGSPCELCDLGDIPAGDYPIQSGKDPNDFIHSITKSRSKTEILDENDLYYRLDWACVDARINGTEPGVNPGLVYERHYALNWLINYSEQEWDDISCDT